MTSPPTGPSASGGLYPYGQSQSANLADILERVLDKGIVIVGDIRVNLLDIELLTIKLRLLVASVDKAREIGIDWWEHDPALSSRAERHGSRQALEEDRRAALEEENELLRSEVRALRARTDVRRDELTAAGEEVRRRPAPEADAARRAADEPPRRHRPAGSPDAPPRRRAPDDGAPSRRRTPDDGPPPRRRTSAGEGEPAGRRRTSAEDDERRR
ncbi:gas vesicle protein GvpJ [Streptomyces fradiae]|uniref:gas vesicle protein GvpJ n=1 Tax=Streptomyces fradiae TaxID=1906 RepID=UPI0036F519A9